MKQTPLTTRQTAAALALTLAIFAAGLILNYFMKALGCLMIYISETCNVPL